MATFEPQVPSQADPRYYLHLSHPISEPHFANAGAEAMKNVGEIIQKGTHAVKDILEGVGENIGEESAKKNRTELTENLTNTLDTLQYGQSQVDPNTFVKPTQSLVQTTGQDIPKDLSNLPKTLDGLESAKANGKISLTQYYAEQDKLASDLRSRYSWSPALVNGIDRAFAKVVGGDPANLRIHSLLSDINSYSQGKDKALDEFNQLLKTHPFSEEPGGFAGGWEQLWEDVNVTKKRTVAEGMRILAPYVAQKYKYQIDSERFKNDQEQKTVNETKATKRLDDIVSHINFNTNLGHNLNDLDGWTPDKLSNTYQTALRHPEAFDPDSLKFFENKYLSIAQKVGADFDRTVAAEGIDKVLGPTKIAEYRKHVLEPWTTMAELWGHGKQGLAAGFKQQLDDMHAYNGIRVFKDKELAAPAAVLSGLRAGIGDALAQKVGERDPTIFSALTGGVKNLTTALKARATYETQLQLSAPDPRFTSANSFKESLGRVLEIAEENGVDTSKPSPETAESVKDLKRLATDNDYGVKSEKLWREHPETAERLAYRLFNPNNYGMLKNIAPDTVDDKGNKTDGRETWFSDWTDKKISERLAQSKYAGMYKDWTEHMFQQEILPGAIKDLAASRFSSTNVTKRTQDQVRFGWDNSDGDKAPRMFLEVNGKEWKSTYAKGGIIPRGLFGGGQSNREYDSTNKTLDRINKGLEGLYNVYKAQGIPDVDHVVAGALARDFLGTNDPNIQKLTDEGRLPMQLIQAIQAARTAPKTEEQVPQKKKE